MKVAEKIYRWLGFDGLLHILSSLVIVAIAAAVLPLWIAAVSALVLGIAKETVWDLFLHRGTASWHDMICNLAGIALGAMLCLIN